MLNNLKRICVVDQAARRQAVLDSLREMPCPYTLQSEEIDGSNPVNIVVTLRAGTPKLIVGAHYDSVPGSTGANDNGASVCILLEIIRLFLHAPPGLPLEIVFFDLEEQSMKGSTVYTNHLIASDVLAMINLDLCGVGDHIVIGPRKNTALDPFVGPILKTIQSNRHPIAMVELMPISDDMLFEYSKVPTISVCMAPVEDVDAIEQLAYAMHSYQTPDKVPSLLDTMHNRARDSIESVEVSALTLAFEWLKDLITAFSV